MVFNDQKIMQWAEAGGVSPYDPKLVNPASIDLRLGNKYRVPEGIGSWSPAEFTLPESNTFFSCGSFLLMHSLEYTKIPNNVVGLLFSKSSTGRKGIEHLHAGYGDPGFEGQWTFEVHIVHPYGALLCAGMRLFQLVLVESEIPNRLYVETGRYQGQKGATPSCS